MKILLFLLAASTLVNAQNFTADKSTEHGITVIHLKDHARAMDVTIVPEVGNRAISFTVHGKNILYVPDDNLIELQKHPGLNGIPFLAPWANRLDSASYWANGKQYQLNPNLKNYTAENNGYPIHGLLAASPLWEVTDVAADDSSAHVTSRLVFWKYPDLMAQWPFAQEYEMTYRLADGTLEVRTSIVNRSVAPIPVSIGFHPYYRLPDRPRDEWTVELAVRSSIESDKTLIPTGETKPLALPNPLPLKNSYLDNGFTDMQRDSAGLAHFAIESGSEKIEILFGPKYPVAVLWEPPARHGPSSEFFCIEPMTAPTDALNLAHAGKYDKLQSVPPGGTWTESFWVKPTGF